jgi:hypothetical protein
MGAFAHQRSTLKEGEGKGADRGVDGLLCFYETKEKRQRIIVQVKGGGVKRSDVAALVGDVNNQEAAAGVSITLEKPTKAMKDEAVGAGRYKSKLWHDRDYPKIQILTVEELITSKVRLPAPPKINPLSKAARETKPHSQPDLI